MATSGLGMSTARALASVAALGSVRRALILFQLLMIKCSADVPCSMNRVWRAG